MSELLYLTRGRYTAHKSVQISSRSYLDDKIYETPELIETVLIFWIFPVLFNNIIERSMSNFSRTKTYVDSVDLSLSKERCGKWLSPAANWFICVSKSMSTEK